MRQQLESDMGLLSFLTGGISDKYAAVQNLANQLSVDEAIHCYSLAIGQLCMYLQNPFDPSASIYNKTAYIEAVVALYERLRDSHPSLSLNKGSFRMALTKAVLRDFTGQPSPSIARQLHQFDFHLHDHSWSSEDEERLGYHVQDMLSAGP